MLEYPGQLSANYRDARDRLEAFFGRYPERVYDEGEVVIQADERPLVYLVERGLAWQYQISEKGSNLVIDSFGSGDIFPLADIVTGQPASFFVETRRQLAVRAVPADDFLKFLDADQRVAGLAMILMAQASHRLSHHLAAAMEGEAQGRVWQRLLASRQQVDGDSDIVEATEADLAAQTGLARETVNRSLRRLAAQGLVLRLERGRLRIIVKQGAAGL